MNIGLIKLDGKLVNIALEKIKLYHEQKGDNVKYISELEAVYYDKVYCSSIFSFTDKSYVRDSWICGGTGFDLSIKLPPEIENMKPKINVGFTTRGCIRNCEFCVVPKAEGKIKIVGDIYDFWDGKSKDIILYDNNILALPRHFNHICEQIKKENLRVDFNQGLDCRLLSENMCRKLSELRHKEYHFAFDDISYENQVKSAIQLLNKHGIRRATWYVLVGFNTDFENDYYRINLLRNKKQNVYVQRYNGIKLDRVRNELYSWAMQKHIFQAHTFEQYCKIRKCKTGRAGRGV